MLWRRLPGCNCRSIQSLTATSSIAGSSVTLHRSQFTLATTSRVKVEDLEHASSPFEHLLPNGARAASQCDERNPSTSKGRTTWRRRRTRNLNRLNAIEIQGNESAPAPTTSRPSASSSVSQISPYLPIITRERSHLIATLRSTLSGLSTATPGLSSSKQGQLSRRRRGGADATWAALAQVLRYPELVPDMPTTSHPTSARLAFDLDDDESSFGSGVDDRGHVDQYGGRTKIELSVSELRAAFDVFASARPRTREGLNRLLVVAELLAQKARQSTSPPSSSSSPYQTDDSPSTAPATGSDGNGAGAASYDQTVRELPSGGLGLREQDWRTLIMFAGAARRAPRSTVELESALLLFSQLTSTSPLSSNKRAQIRAGLKSPEETDPEHVHFIPELATFNALLHLARRTRAWELASQVLKRMEELGIRGDAFTSDIRMLIDDQRGIHIEAIWNSFEKAITDARDRRRDVARTRRREHLWGTMLWICARRGLMDEAMAIYGAMRDGKPRSLTELKPGRGEWQDEPRLEDTAEVEGGPRYQLPPPNMATYTGLIQAFAHQGDLTSALQIMRDMARLDASESDARGALGISPTPHMFACLFRGFARFGLGPQEQARLSTAPWSKKGSSFATVPRRLLSDGDGHEVGVPRKSNTLATIRGVDFSALRSSGRGRRDGEAAAGPDATQQPWTIEALNTLFDSFLALEPPSATSPTTSSSSSSRRLPFDGARTAPSSKELFWLVLAYEVMTDDDSHVVLAVWDAVERTFGGSRTGTQQRTGAGAGTGERNAWTGWRVDRRMRERIQAHERRVRAMDAAEEAQANAVEATT